MTLPALGSHWNVNSKFRLRNMIDPPPYPHFMHPSADSATPKIKWNSSIKTMFIRTLFQMLFRVWFWSESKNLIFFWIQHNGCVWRNEIFKIIAGDKRWFQELICILSQMATRPGGGHFLPVSGESGNFSGEAGNVQIAKSLQNRLPFTNFPHLQSEIRYNSPLKTIQCTWHLRFWPFLPSQCNKYTFF